MAKVQGHRSHSRVLSPGKAGLSLGSWDIWSLLSPCLGIKQCCSRRRRHRLERLERLERTAKAKGTGPVIPYGTVTTRPGVDLYSAVCTLLC